MLVPHEHNCSYWSIELLSTVYMRGRHYDHGSDINKAAPKEIILLCIESLFTEIAFRSKSEG